MNSPDLPYRFVVRILRERLSEGDARDIGNDFGRLAGLGGQLYDRVGGGSFDARIAALVERALQVDKLPELLQVSAEWRPDLAPELAQCLPPVSPAATAAQHNLPPRRGAFIGRARDVERVLEGLSSRYPLVSIEGIGGVGKTTLAVEVAYACITAGPQDASWEYVAWISAMDRPDQKRWLNDVLNAVAKVLGYFAVAQLPPDRLAEKEAEIERLLRSHQVLVVIDNVETIDDPELARWMEFVPEPSHVLITTRQSRRERVWAIPLGGLSEPEALALIRQEARASALHFLVAASDVELRPLIDVTDGNPRALELALGYVKSGELSLQETVEQLGEAGEDVEDVFDYLFQHSWALLTQESKNLVLVSPLFAGEITREALRAVSGLSSSALKQALKQVSLVRFFEVDPAQHRYAVHPMTRAFARRRLADDPLFEQEARNRWSRYYLDFVRAHVARADPPVPYWNALVSDSMTAIDSEWASIAEVLSWAAAQDRKELLLDLVVLLLHYMDSRFFNLERMEYAKRAAEAAADLGRRGLEALLRIDALAWTYIEENRMDAARSEIERGLRLAELTTVDSTAAGGSSGLVALGSAWLARIHAEEGRYEEAEQLIIASLDQVMPPWIRYRVSMAAGDIAFKRGDGGRALELYNDAVREYERYGGEGHGYQIEPRIGLALLADGQLEAAEARFRTLRAHEQLAIGKLYAEYGIAAVSLQRGRLDEAVRSAQTARRELHRRTSSNLLVKLIDELFTKLESQTSAVSSPVVPRAADPADRVVDPG